ncbi:MAG: hypothetical protein QM811_16615 [Pirellulales bacterium]
MAFAAVVAVFAIVQTGVSYWQWKAMRFEQRPWLSMAIPKLEGDPYPDMVCFRVTVKNVGHSPARIVKNSAFLACSPIDADVDDPVFGSVTPNEGNLDYRLKMEPVEKHLNELDEWNEPSMVIPPGEELPILFSIKGPGKEFDRYFNDGFACTLLYVRIKYEGGDTLGETMGCFVYERAFEKKFILCPKYNTMK